MHVEGPAGRFQKLACLFRCGATSRAKEDCVRPIALLIVSFGVFGLGSARDPQLCNAT
jgi:hypothetical protein